LQGGINIPCCRHYGYEYVNPLCVDREMTLRRRCLTSFRSEVGLGDKRLISIASKISARATIPCFSPRFVCAATVINAPWLWLTAIAGRPIIYLFTQIA